MQTYLVVIDPPSFDGFSCVVESKEPVFIQTFLAELAVEAPDVAFLHRPAAIDEGSCTWFW